MSGGNVRMTLELSAGDFAYFKYEPVNVKIGPFRLRTKRLPALQPDVSNASSEDLENMLREEILMDLEMGGPIARAIKEFAARCEQTRNTEQFHDPFERNETP